MALVLPATDILYQTYDGSFQMECEAKVLSYQILDDATVQICLNQTVLHSQGGGQPTDKGEIIVSGSGETNTAIEVTKVTMDRATGVVTHAGTIKNGDSGDSTVTVTPGDSVHVKVDEANRQLMSECVSPILPAWLTPCWENLVFGSMCYSLLLS